jgi:hypothetical protein
MKERRCCTSPVSVAEAYAGFVVDLEEGPEGLRFGVGPPEAGYNARSLVGEEEPS